MYKNKAFISYRHSSRDKKISEMIQRKLENYRIPGDIASKYGIRKIGRVFRDQTDLGARPDLSEELRKELDESEYLLVVCSPETAESRWVLREIKYFLKHHSASNILPVLADGDPLIVLPEIFGGIEELPAEITACDFRKGSGSRRRREISRLASALIGCGYDELINREQRFRMVRGLTVSAAVVCLLAGAAAYHHMSSMQLKKSRDEKLISDAKRLAAQSGLSRQNREWFDSLRFALEAFPEGGDDGPVAEEAVYALQKALQAYSPGTEHSFVQTGEFSTDGIIDDWSCLETEEGTWLAAQSDDSGEYALDVWDITRGNKVIEVESRDVLTESRANRDKEINSAVTEDFGQPASFLLTDKSVIWSCGNQLVSIDLMTGNALWKISADGAYQQTLLAGDRNMLAVHVSSGSEEGESQGEYIQIRSLLDGSLIGSMEVGHPEGKVSSGFDGYSEIPKAMFAEDGTQTVLILEEDFHYYDDQTDHSCLRLIYPHTMESFILTEGIEIADFAVLNDTSVLTAMCGKMTSQEEGREEDGETLWLKCFNLKTAGEEWSVKAGNLNEENVYILAGRAPVLISGTHAACYEADSGREIYHADFPSLPVDVSISDASDGSVLTAVSEEGSYYAWDMQQEEVLPLDSVFPSTISRAEQLNDTVLLHSTDENRNIHGDRISLFQKGHGDPDLCKVDLAFSEAGSEEGIIRTVSYGTQYVLVTEEGKAYGIDAATGTENWSADLGIKSELGDVSEEDGRMLFYTFPDSLENDSETGNTWTILSMETGKALTIKVPGLDSASVSGHFECRANSLSGDYIVSIVSEENAASGSSGTGRTYIIRYPIDGTFSAVPDSIDITDSVSGYSRDFTLCCSRDGCKSVCLCPQKEEGIAGLLLYMDWAKGELQEMSFENSICDSPDSLVKWSQNGRYIAVPDDKNNLWIIDLEDRDFPDSARQITGSSTMDEIHQTGADRESLLAGYDYYKNDLVVVEARENRLWVSDQEGRFNLELPVSEDNALDPEVLSGMKMWTLVSATETKDGKILLAYGDEAFLIEPEDNAVEAAVEKYLSYNRETDTLLLNGEKELYISRRYSVQELVEKGKKILQGSK